MINTSLSHHEFGDANDTLFARIASDLREKGYSINPAALPESLGEKLYQHLGSMEQEKFDQAGIGRDRQLMQNTFVRRDEICWITGESDAGRAWLDWTSHLQVFLNRQLFLGLFSFESHFSHYAAGDFYKRHVDAFKGQDNRILSVVVYLNHNWTPENGGELVLFKDKDDVEGIKVTPGFGTVLVFLSEEFPHEVRPTNRDRYSIAGWFRLNTSTTDRVDPPS
jgi:SM-20-related protein